MEKKGPSGLSGSYTVEMALLFPLILGIFIFILGMTFYLYDLCVLDISANLAAAQGEKYADWSDRNIERKVSKLAEKEVENSLIAVKNLTVSVQVKDSKVCVLYTGEYMFPILNVFLGGKSKNTAISVEAQSVIQNAVEWIRTVRRIGRVADYIKESVK
jgi:Flp pilus assembly protein TadG